MTPNENERVRKAFALGSVSSVLFSLRTHGYKVQESRDGRALYFYAGETNVPIRVLDRATGQEKTIKGMPNVDYPTDWVVGSKGIFYTDSTSTPAASHFMNFLQRVSHDGSQLRSSSKNGEGWRFRPTKRG